MRTRLQLHERLCNILESRNAYFRPPAKGMKYPCIIYDLDGDDPKYADNISYMNHKRWSLTAVDQNPDSEIPEKIGLLPHCRFVRAYQADGLNHFIYELYW